MLNFFHHYCFRICALLTFASLMFKRTFLLRQENKEKIFLMRYIYQYMLPDSESGTFSVYNPPPHNVKYRREI